ncbi:alpha/beta hydrolase [Pseudomonas aeruginosa]|nr:alpha/beta hydrolase [Pseudomonas aeruginosa]
MVVFIHGWKHNAGRDDGNVASFNKALANLASSGVLGKRRLVGLYVGWRGKSMRGLYSENLTYRDRKAVAEEVGRGGVAELLAQLERIDRKDRNYLVIVGHSFGGAITLGALHDPLLERLLALRDGQRIRAFGDAVIMLNPAIEANQGLLLKENSLQGRRPGNPAAAAAVRHQFARRQRHPLRLPARPMGRRQPHLEPGGPDRTYNGTRYRLREEDLDTTALGNYSLYRTALLIDRECPLPDGSDNCAPRPPEPRVIDDTDIGKWRFRSFCRRGRRQRRSGAAAHALLAATSRSTSSTPRSPSSPTTTISSTTR